MAQNRRRIEPFCLFGTDSIIYTKEEAAKVAADNSYYFMVAGCIILAIAAIYLWKPLPRFSITYLVLNSISYIVLAFALRKHKSRIASILLLSGVIWSLIPRLTQLDIGGTFIFNLLLVAAASRAVKATFFFHSIQ
jgi:hypothetical protein